MPGTTRVTSAAWSDGAGELPAAPGSPFGDRKAKIDRRNDIVRLLSASRQDLALELLPGDNLEHGLGVDFPSFVANLERVTLPIPADVLDTFEP